MLGAIIGDIVGSVYEYKNIKTTQFQLFSKDSCYTDDSVMTLAVAQAILEGKDYSQCMKKLGRKYPDAGYGHNFYQWILEDQTRPYNSYGNGSAMRVSPVGFAFNKIDDVLKEAKKSAEVSHNHPEGIKGAQAVAVAVFMARHQKTKNEIKNEIQNRFGYNLNRTLNQIRPGYHYDISCQGTVPEAITAFLESSSFEDAVRKAISLGGDSDTLTCITGGIAQAHYKKIPDDIRKKACSLLPKDLLDILNRFEKKYK